MEKNQDNKLIRLAGLIKSYVLTEKSTKLYEFNERQYSFTVDPSLKKQELKALLELLFSVKIQSIRTLNIFCKKKKVGKFLGKKSSKKKVYITLKMNQKIDNLYN